MIQESLPIKMRTFFVPIIKRKTHIKGKSAITTSNITKHCHKASSDDDILSNWYDIARNIIEIIEFYNESNIIFKQE